MSGLGSACPSAFPPADPWERAAVTGRQWASRIESALDWRAVCSAVAISNILGFHVAGTCSPLALRALADAHAAQGIAAADYSNRKHAHTWLITWQRLTLDADAGAQG